NACGFHTGLGANSDCVSSIRRRAGAARPLQRVGFSRNGAVRGRLPALALVRGSPRANRHRVSAVQQPAGLRRWLQRDADNSRVERRGSSRDGCKDELCACARLQRAASVGRPDHAGRIGAAPAHKPQRATRLSRAQGTTTSALSSPPHLVLLYATSPCRVTASGGARRLTWPAPSGLLLAA